MKSILPILAILTVAAMAWGIDQISVQPSRSPMHAAAYHGTDSDAEIYAAGRVEGATEQIELRSEIAGRIAEIHFREGSRVSAGDLLFHLDDTTQTRQLDLAAARVDLVQAKLVRLVNGAHPQERAEARAQMKAAIAKRDLAKKTWKRISALQTSQAITEHEVDVQHSKVHLTEANVAAATALVELLDSPTRQDDVHIAKNELNVAKAQLQLHEAELAKTRILAPVAGTILRIESEAGELVGPDSEQPVFFPIQAVCGCEPLWKNSTPLVSRRACRQLSQPTACRGRNSWAPCPQLARR